MKGIYCITNRINGKKYVGLSNNINRRFMEHKTPKNVKDKTTVLARAFRKYFIENFDFEILEIVESVEELEEREIFWIEKLNPEYNMNEGGGGNRGYELSEEVKNHLSILGKLQWASKTDLEKQKTIKRLTAPRKRKPRSEETKKKLREANKGKKMSQETKDKISKANKIAAIGNKNGNKPVIAYSDNENIIFESTKKAADHFGVNPSCITGVLKGRRKTCRGYKWKYKQ